MWSRRRKAVRANTVNNPDTERDRATPVQDIDMYLCMYVCMYVCTYVCIDVCIHIHIYACMYVYMCVCISLPMSIIEGSSAKRIDSPTVGVHSVRQLHVGASRLSRVFVSDASGEGITCSCVAPCTLCTAYALGYARTCLRPRSPCSRS